MTEEVVCSVIITHTHTHTWRDTHTHSFLLSPPLPSSLRRYDTFSLLLGSVVCVTRLPRRHSSSIIFLPPSGPVTLINLSHIMETQLISGRLSCTRSFVVMHRRNMLKLRRAWTLCTVYKSKAPHAISAANHNKTKEVAWDHGSRLQAATLLMKIHTVPNCTECRFLHNVALIKILDLSAFVNCWKNLGWFKRRAKQNIWQRCSCGSDVRNKIFHFYKSNSNLDFFWFHHNHVKKLGSPLKPTDNRHV